jgi:hypothetical protein
MAMLLRRKRSETPFPESQKWRPTVEALECRTLPSICAVNTLGDTGAGRRGFGDLRYCINRANDLPGADTIRFAVQGTIGTIALSSDLPWIIPSLAIDGPGAGLLEVSGQGKFRVFQVGGGSGAVTLRGLTIAGGLDMATTGGAGILNYGQLAVQSCVIRDNQVRVTGGFIPSAIGGGIYNAGTMTLINSAVTNNLAYASSTEKNGEYGKGGGIANPGQLTVLYSRVDGNTATSEDPFDIGDAAEGGGIYNSGFLDIRFSSLDGNHASVYYAYAAGGGVYNLGVANISDSTFAYNYAQNQLDGAEGGAIDNSGTLRLTNFTVSANGSFEVGGGIYSAFQATLALRSTIVAGIIALYEYPDLYGTLTATGYNLFGNSQGGSGYDSTDLLNVDPKLGPLQDNGGPTLTMALLPCSPAIDSGDNANAPEWDQRGPRFPRIVNGQVDRGAFEVQHTAGPTKAHLVSALSTAPPIRDTRAAAARSARIRRATPGRARVFDRDAGAAQQSGGVRRAPRCLPRCTRAKRAGFASVGLDRTDSRPTLTPCFLKSTIQLRNRSRGFPP